MHLVRFDPFRFAWDLSVAAAERRWAPRVDVINDEDRILVRFEVPGVDAEGIDVNIEDGLLVVTGTRTFEDESTAWVRHELAQGEFRRAVALPDEVDTDQVSATYAQGILTIALPKRPEVLPRKVHVEVAAS